MIKTQKTLLRTRPRQGLPRDLPAARSAALPIVPEGRSSDRQQPTRAPAEIARQGPQATTTACPSCGAKLLVDPDRIKKKLQCPKCLGLIIPSSTSASTAPLKSPGETLQADSEHDARLAELRARASDLARQLDHAQAALKEAAGMVARIGDVEVKLNTLAVDYVRALLRIEELHRENMSLRGEREAKPPGAAAPTRP